MKAQNIDITRIIGDVIKRVQTGLQIKCTDYDGTQIIEHNPHVNYVFGSARYVKENLDEISKIGDISGYRLPLIALFTPIAEERNTPDFSSVAKVNMLIACATNRDWNNHQRREFSFDNVLRPIYRRFMDELKADKRLDFGYNPVIKHRYSENYSYGKYGAYTSTGEEVSEPIDAIDIRNLELKIKLLTCR